MIEKVNPKHPDKVADRIAGAIVDLGYKLQDNPKIAVEVLIGHGICHVIAETSVNFKKEDIENIISRIAGDMSKDVVLVSQDTYLSKNQEEGGGEEEEEPSDVSRRRCEGYQGGRWEG